MAKACLFFGCYLLVLNVALDAQGRPSQGAGAKPKQDQEAQVIAKAKRDEADRKKKAKDEAKRKKKKANAEADRKKKEQKEADQKNYEAQKNGRVWNLAPIEAPTPLRALWYGIIGFTSLASLLMLYTNWRLWRMKPKSPSPFSAISAAPEGIRKMAASARDAYKKQGDSLRARDKDTSPLKSPAHPSQSWRPGTELDSRLPTQKESAPEPPALIPFNPLPSTQGDEMMVAYHQARSSLNPVDRKNFEERYQTTLMTCWNQEAWRRDKTTTLRFRPDDYGWYLVLVRGGATIAFPGFKKDLAGERQSFEGVFQYPEGGETTLVVARAAGLKQEGEEYTLATPGRIDPDV